MYVITILHAPVHARSCMDGNGHVHAANTSQALQSAVQRIETYVKTLEEKVDSKRK